MQNRAESLGLSGSVTTILRDLIHDQLGLYFEPHQFDALTDKLAPLVVERGAESFMDYYYLLKYAPGADDWLKVMDALAVNETYFWREIDQLRAVVSEVVPTLIDRLHGRPLRIWSVPCASGEEPLTIAMLLSEGGWFARAPIQIIGSDASPRAIARAEAGIYRDRSFRNLPPALREKYFVERDGAWHVAGTLRQRVTYDVVNLMSDDQVTRYASAPVVVFRNVFIYFSEHSIRRVLGVFERSMPVPGYLCVAAAESLLRRTMAFELKEIGGAFIYTKRDPVQRQPVVVAGIQKVS